MKISRFVNNLENAPLHSSEFAGKSAPAPQSFTERQQLERQRRTVGGYQRSLVGGSYGGRGQIRPMQRPGTIPPSSLTRTSMPEGQNFKEPPARGYSPYS